MAPVEKEEEGMESIIVEEVQEGEEDTTMHDVTAAEEVEEEPKETTTRVKRGRPRKAAVAVAETPMSVTATATRGGGRGRKKKAEEPVVEEETTQQDEVTEEVTHEETQLEEEEEEEESLPIPGAWRNGPPAPASTSRKSSSLGLGFKTHTAAGTRNSDEVELRRKLGEMTQKYEALELKYRDLREVAVKEAERNFDRLRKQSEERTAGMFKPPFRIH